MSLFARAIFLAFGLVFIMAGAVQVNDPDPFVWVTIYSVAAALSLAAIVTSIPRWLIFLEAVAALVALVIMLTVGFELALRDTEEMRELGGILLVLVHAVVLASLSRSPFELWVDGRRLH